ncbi:hypothetical protein V8E53_014857 [Lactarius tabidus]
MPSCIPPLRSTDSEHIMIFSSASNGRAPSHPPSHFRSSLDPQQPWSFNRPEMRFDAPQRSMAPPNSDPELASNLHVSQTPTSSSHLPSTIGGSSRSQDFSVYGATPSYLPDGPHAVSATETTALRQPSYPPSRTSNTYLTIPSAGPSSFGGEQPTFLSWNNGTAQLGPAIAASVPARAPPPPTALPLPPSSSDTRTLNHFPTAPTAPAQGLDVPDVNVTTSWSHPPGGRRTRVSPRPRGPRTRGPRTVPLVRVEDEVVWVRPHVLKVTLWLNWSPNADAQAHEPWN